MQYIWRANINLAINFNLKISHILPYQLQFVHPFVLAHGTRSYTNVVYVGITEGNQIGWGEAALPPYLSETQDSVIQFLKQINLKGFSAKHGVAGVCDYLKKLGAENKTAKAAIEMAVYDLWGKLNLKPLREILELKAQMPPSTYTISLCNKDELLEKLKVAESFPLLKIKLGTGQDRAFVELLKTYSDKAFAVDANQGWNNMEQAQALSSWLQEMGAVLIEQPFAKSDFEKHGQFSRLVSLPVFADESFQSYDDLEKLKDNFSGINIKLSKCGGLSEAFKIKTEAAKLGLKILVGCMSESSCGVSAAAHLALGCSYADLDGPWLIKNDPFDGLKIKQQKLIFPEESFGLQVQLVDYNLLNTNIL